MHILCLRSCLELFFFDRYAREFKEGSLTFIMLIRLHLVYVGSQRGKFDPFPTVDVIMSSQKEISNLDHALYGIRAECVKNGPLLMTLVACSSAMLTLESLIEQTLSPVRRGGGVA